MYQHLRSLISGFAIFIIILLGPLARVSAAGVGPEIGDPAWFTPGLDIQPAFSGCTRVDVPPVNAAFEQQVVDLVNQHRASIGVAPLKRNTNLDYAARYHAADMAQDEYFDHDTYDGRGGITYVCETWTRVDQFYTGYNAAGENIAAGHDTPEEVMQAWLKSPGHRANIERATFNEIGVGFYAGGPYGAYWVQDFGYRETNEAALGGLPESITFYYGLNNHLLIPEGYDLQPINSLSSHVISWTVTKSSFDANWLALNAISGSTPSGCLHAAPVNIMSFYATTGEHTGALTFTASAQAGVTLLNSPISVPVRLVIAETVHAVYLPSIIR